MLREFDVTRRSFLKIGAALGGGLLLGVRVAAGAAAEGTPPQAETSAFAPNAWVRIGSDDSITVIIDRSEMGQGVLTSLAMLVAEELEVPLEKLRIEFAPAAPAYVNKLSGVQSTGGSTSIRNGWEALREAGATAREMLIAAAAQKWQVASDGCRAEAGTVIHPDGQQRLSYGALAERAARQPAPQAVKLKDPEKFSIIGKPTSGLDIHTKVNGSASFGIDVRLPGLLSAVVARCPVFGGTVKSFDAKAAREVPGVRHVVTIDSGIAVVADNFWSASRGRERLNPSWDEGGLAGLDSAAIRQRFVQAAEQPGSEQRAVGNVTKGLAKAAQRIEAEYETPYLAHAAMEPMNCTVLLDKRRCDVWVPTQAQTAAQTETARLTGLPQAAVHIHTTFVGCGFGRRLNQDFVSEAVQIAKTIDRPVQLLWTISDDLQHDHYRPANLTRLQGGVDAKGRPNAWLQRIVGPRIALGGVDIPYAIPNLRIEQHEVDPGVPTGPWRSVGASQNAFMVEGFIDELAHAAGADPYEYRRGLLGKASRHRGVLELAAHKAGWGSPLPKNHGRGIAVYFCFASWVAEVAEVELSPQGDLRVQRVVVAIDCGRTVNPDGVVAQMEGAVAFALTAALRGEITLADGRVVQSNFNDYPLLTMAEMPAVEVYIMPSEQPPGGVGEPGVPPLAPALGNAIFAASGKRLRRLPFGMRIA
jgi:isoquinoline 1-oxidoreductase beta subunit